MHVVLKIYEDIAEATSRMLEAARNADWDALVAADSECATHIERARTVASDPLGDEERRMKARLIRRMLAHDAEIRACVQPWMSRLEELLSASAQRHRAREGYRTASGET